MKGRVFPEEADLKNLPCLVIIRIAGLRLASLDTGMARPYNILMETCFRLT